MLRKLIALSLLLCFIPFCLGVAEPVTLFVGNRFDVYKRGIGGAIP